MGQNIRGFCGWSSDYEYLPTNEATLPTFTCSASSNHKNIMYEMTKLLLLNHEHFVPQKLPAIQYRYVFQE